MKGNLSRNKKIEMLKNIYEGKITTQHLQPCKVYFFASTDLHKGIYKGPADLTQSDGQKEYDQKEYDAFCKQVRELNKASIPFYTFFFISSCTCYRNSNHFFARC